MISLLTPESIAELEEQANRRWGITPEQLMQNAGQSLARQVVREARRLGCREVMVAAGPGNNGGDGVAAAARLGAQGIHVRLLLLDAGRRSPLLEKQLSQLSPALCECTRIDQPHLPESSKQQLREAPLLVDALLGIGLRDEPRGVLAEGIAAINDGNGLRIACDVPSGLQAESGRCPGVCVRADMTLTLGAPKMGLFQDAALGVTGKVIWDPIGLPPEILAWHPPAAGYYTEADARSALPRRSLLAHKKIAGRVLVIGGCAGYHGALLLAALGASRVGAGYVSLAFPGALGTVVRAQTWEWLCHPLGGQSGHLRFRDLKPLLRLAAAHDTVVLGPGIGRDRSTRQLVRALLSNPQFPGAVIDADALHALGTDPLPAHSAPRIMTPHVGEARAMLGEPSQAVGRWELLDHLVQAHPGCHLLKGPHTLIHDPKQPGIRVVDTNTQALATAGTGDVLAGMIAGLLAQGVSVPEAAALAAYLHGRAGESAAVDPIGLGVLAREVADRVPGEIARLRMPGLATPSQVLQDQLQE